MKQTTIKKSTRKLPCLLTDDEVRLRGIDLANANKEYADTKAEKTRIDRELNDKLKDTNERIHELKDAVRNGVEVRPVEVEIYVDRYLGKIRVTRMDTAEIIIDRLIQQDDYKQLELDMEDDDE